jgi:hypothetical protein
VWRGVFDSQFVVSPSTVIKGSENKSEALRLRKELEVLTTQNRVLREEIEALKDRAASAKPRAEDTDDYSDDETNDRRQKAADDASDAVHADPVNKLKYGYEGGSGVLGGRRNSAAGAAAAAKRDDPSATADNKDWERARMVEKRLNKLQERFQQVRSPSAADGPLRYSLTTQK